MPKFKLYKNHALNKYSDKVNGIYIFEITDVEIFAMAIPSGKEKIAMSSFKQHFKCKMPAVGKLEMHNKKDIKLLRMSYDQLFVIEKSKEKNELEKAQTLFRNKFYITEQTDSWVGLTIGGNRINECLERMCSIDISIETFKVNAFARTVMEHLGVIIIRTKVNEFEIFSASSSIKSFLHTITTSAKNI